MFVMSFKFKGGGWCIDLEDCAARSKTVLGSSNTWTAARYCYDQGGHDGLMSQDESVNPLMYNWNRIYVGYCDGASLSGKVEEPVQVPNSQTSVHFKGGYQLDAFYDIFINDYGLATATDIVIGGSSAGGLAVILHLDYISK